MAKKENLPDKKNNNKEDHQWQFRFLLDQFSQESDRAAVILVASILDESLATLLKSYLVPIPTAQDSLFDSATSPLSNFSSKIDMAFRIGLISSKLARDIHIVRKIRNSFAHDIYGCNFGNGSVISRIKELENSMSKSWLKKLEEIDRDDNLLDGNRGKFLAISGAMIYTINDLIKNTTEINIASNEWFYAGT